MDSIIIIFGLGFSFIMGWLCSLEHASIKRKTK